MNSTQQVKKHTESRLPVRIMRNPQVMLAGLTQERRLALAGVRTGSLSAGLTEPVCRLSLAALWCPGSLAAGSNHTFGNVSLAVQVAQRGK